MGAQAARSFSPWARALSCAEFLPTSTATATAHQSCSQDRREGPTYSLRRSARACFCTTNSREYGLEVITNTRPPHCPDKTDWLTTYYLLAPTYALPSLTAGQDLRSGICAQVACSLQTATTYPIAGLAHPNGDQLALLPRVEPTMN